MLCHPERTRGPLVGRGWVEGPRESVLEHAASGSFHKNQL